MSKNKRKRADDNDCLSDKRAKNVSLSTPGLYDCRGTLLVAVPGHDSIIAKVFDQEYTLQVQPDGSTLTIARWVRSDDREDRCRTFVEDRANKIESRKRDMEALQEDISAKQDEFEDEYLDLDTIDIKKELIDSLALRGKHKAELKILESYADAKVAITETRKGESVVLPLKELVQVDFFEEPVVYLQSKLVVAPVKITEVAEKLEVPLSAWQAEHITGTYVSTLGIGPGSEHGQSTGVAVSGEFVFVTGLNNCKVHVYSRGSGAFVRSFGSQGADDGQLKRPGGIAVSGEHVFVADCNNDRISVYTKQGAFVRIIGDGSGAGDGQLREPMALTVSGEHLFVADSENDRISVFTVGGEFVKIFGTLGFDLGQLHCPTGVAASDNLIFVAEIFKSRVSVFTHYGEFVRVIPSSASQVCVAGNRVFFTNRNHSVSIHRLDGTFVRKFGSAGAGNNQFNVPRSVAVAGDRLYVTDLFNERVQVFV